MSQLKGGYYAAPPEAVASVLERLQPPDRGGCLILDPCAGESHALVQLAQGLQAAAFGIELSEDRAAVLRQSLPTGQALAPADFFRCAISYRSFSFIWCNPPYDYATGEEGRMESQFIERAADLPVDRGVLALVCPEDVAREYRTIDFFQERFSQVSALPFPAQVRKYSETMILGIKRKQPNPNSSFISAGDWLERRMEDVVVYRLPPGQPPRRFRKTEPTDTELARLVAQSSLRFLIEQSAHKAADRPRPPMSPGIGHRAMLLASGHIDGLISPPGERPHVVRGTASKQQYVASCDESEDEEGNLTSRTVISERPRLASAGLVAALQTTATMRAMMSPMLLAVVDVLGRLSPRSAMADLGPRPPFVAFAQASITNCAIEALPPSSTNHSSYSIRPPVSPKLIGYG